MTVLTPTKIAVMNNATREINSAVRLGDEVEAIIEEINTVVPKLLGVLRTPVNAAKAKATLTLTGVVLHGQKVIIGADAYQFTADTAKTVDEDHIAVDIKASTTAATGNLTMITQPTSGDTVTVGVKTYIFVPVGTDNEDGEVSIGGNLAGAQAALVAAINGTDSHNEAHPNVRAATFAANVSAITAIIGGVAGNAIATTETFTAVGNVFAAVTLETGADCTAANAITALVAAVTASDTQGITATDGAGDTVVFEAPIGAAGNNIVISENLANGTFGVNVNNLSGGADTTSPNGGRFMVDATNLYVYVTDTWYKLVLGSL